MNSFKNNRLFSKIISKIGHIETVKILLEKGADIHSKDRNGEIPMHRAAESGNLTLKSEL